MRVAPGLPFNCRILALRGQKFLTKYPEKEGLFWLYGYRYGKVSCGSETKPELMLMKVRRVANGWLYTADGQFVFPGEVECPHFMEVVTPELPKLEE